MTDLSRFASGFLLWLSLAAAARAQTYEQVAPKPLPVAPAAALPESAPPEAGADDRILVPVLRGLSFHGSPETFRAEGVSGEGVQITGSALLDTEEFRAQMAPYLGRPLSRGELGRLTREVVLYFRRHGRPVIDVSVPEQAVATGTVQVLVTEARLGAVRAEGNIWFSSEQIAAAVRSRPGEVIDGGRLLADLEWINRNPFRQTDLVFSRGSQPGQTDLILRTRDRRPLRVYAGYEDSGNALTGFDRALVGVNWGNAFGRDGQLNYQLSASPDGETFLAHSGSYLIPLPRWRHTLTVFGSFAESQPELAGGLFALEGRSWQLSARYRVPLPARGAWTREFTAGLDFKRSNNDLSFGGTQVFAQENDVVQAVATFSTRRSDARGVTSGELTLALSPGGLTSGNDSGAYEAARAFAQPDYAWARLELARTTQLPAGFSWTARGTAQFASANLLGSEQLGLGGVGGPRGYEEREANGDNGVMLTNELHGPALRLTPRFSRSAPADRLDPLVFLDYGLVSSHRRLPGEPGRLDLASAGLGFRYQLGTSLNVRADYGWQLKESGASDGRRASRGHLSMVLSY